jgi:hypothetical protein
MFFHVQMKKCHTDSSSLLEEVISCCRETILIINHVRREKHGCAQADTQVSVERSLERKITGSGLSVLITIIRLLNFI